MQVSVPRNLSSCAVRCVAEMLPVVSVSVSDHFSFSVRRHALLFPSVCATSLICLRAQHSVSVHLSVWVFLRSTSFSLQSVCLCLCVPLRLSAGLALPACLHKSLCWTEGLCLPVFLSPGAWISLPCLSLIQAGRHVQPVSPSTHVSPASKPLTLNPFPITLEQDFETIEAYASRRCSYRHGSVAARRPQSLNPDL